MRILLWVDDLREPTNFPHIITNKHTIVYWATTYEEAIRLLATKPYISDVSLDNDLGTEKEGRDVLRYIEEKLFCKELSSLMRVNIHSHNPAAVAYMYGSKDVLEFNYSVKVTKVRA